MRSSKRILMSIGLTVLCTLAACAGAPKRASAGGGGTTLTQAQLAATNSGNLYDAITKLKPEWLSSRGPVSATDMTPSAVDVFMNGNLMGRAEYLRQVQLLDVSEVRYWDAGRASARFGMGHPRGVIELVRQ